MNLYIHEFICKFEKSIEARNCNVPLSVCAETISHRHKYEFIIFPRISARLAVVHRCFFLAARTSKKQKEYKDDNLRLSPLAQRIDFTGFYERAQVTRPTAPFISFALFSPLSSSSLPPPLVLTSGWDRKKPRATSRAACPSRASQKRAVRSSITTVRTVVARRKEMIDEREDGKRERKGQEEIGGRVRDRERRGGRRMEENGTMEEPSS